MSAGRAPLMVLVHPGSCCGSANFNLGKYFARAERDHLAHDLNRWNGAIIVADGELSDELPDYPELNSALLGALQRAAEAGHAAKRISACAMNHPDWPKRILKAVKEAGYVAGETIALTGAWVGQHGCVDASQAILTGAGFSTNVLDSAFWETSEDDDADNEDDEDDDDVDEDGRP